jgi:hypothetical protein
MNYMRDKVRQRARPGEPFKSGINKECDCKFLEMMRFEPKHYQGIHKMLRTSINRCQLKLLFLSLFLNALTSPSVTADNDSADLGIDSADLGIDSGTVLKYHRNSLTFCT